MDSSYMSVASVDSANPLDTMMSSLRSQITAEVIATVSGDVVERVLKMVNTVLQNPQVVAQINVPPSAVQVSSTPALVDVTNDIDFSDITACMIRMEGLMQELIAAVKAPMQRTIQRDGENLITTVTDRRM